MLAKRNFRLGWLVSLCITVSGVVMPQESQTPQSSEKRAAQDFQANRLQAKRSLSANRGPLRPCPSLKKLVLSTAPITTTITTLSQAYRRTGQLDKARLEARHLLTIRNTADVHTLLGEIETAAHSAKEAAAEYQIAAQMDPSEDRIFDFGRSLVGFGSDADIKIFSYGVEKYPKSFLLRIGLGEAFDFHGTTRRRPKYSVRQWI